MESKRPCNSTREKNSEVMLTLQNKDKEPQSAGTKNKLLTTVRYLDDLVLSTELVIYKYIYIYL